jgi:hypothetical protein
MGKRTNAKVPGAVFNKKHSIFRPTAMSVAMAKAGIIPDAHLVKDMADTVLVRQRNDTKNLRPSIQIAF